MAVTKILKMNNLKGCLDYIMKKNKTNDGQYISTFECSQNNAVLDFLTVTNEKKSKKNCSNLKVEQYMIIQSFPIGELNHDKAFEIAKKLAKNYLGDVHQYVVVTHNDTSHINSHIVFNATRLDNLKTFNAVGLGFINKLRQESDLLCEEYGLSIIKEPKTNQSYTKGEYYSKKFDRSFKAKLQKIIDKNIKESKTYDEFIEKMSEEVDIKFGKHIAFRMKGQKNFIRSKTLGLDYSETSIKFRIENPEYEINNKNIRRNYFIDKNEEKFQGKNNIGLNRWATKKNIQVLAKVSHDLHIEGKTQSEYIADSDNLFKSMSQLGKEVESLDEKIKYYEDIKDAHHIYKSSFQLIDGYKKAKDKAQYKKNNYSKFKAYDNAKKQIFKEKDNDGKPLSSDAINTILEKLKMERVTKYTNYQETKKQAFSRKETTDNIKNMKKQRER